MKRAIQVVGALAALLLVWGACSKDVCEEAYDKMESCVANLDCNKLDPLERPKCDKAKNAWAQYAGNEQAYLVACSNDSQLEAEAEKVVNCALDPKTCTCP
jgi:hypothetical protein